MPGTSRHHWGSDVDLYSLEDIDFLKGNGKIIYQWLTDNAASYGFCQPYTAGRHAFDSNLTRPPITGLFG